MDSCIYTKIFILMWWRPSLHIQIINHELSGPLTYNIQFHFPIRQSLNIFHPLFVTNKLCQQTETRAQQLNDNLESKVKEAHECSKALYFVTSRIQLQTSSTTDMIMIEDYGHMTTMVENIKWMKLAHLFTFFSLNLSRPLLFAHLHLLQQNQ